MSGTLYLVGTPIGNLQDITSRALEVLAAVDYILAEDTRVTLKLLNHYGISKKLIAYHEHASANKEDIIVRELEEGKSYALVTDAGTPGVSDPGGRLVEKVAAAGHNIVPIPGASAVTTLISVCGLKADAWHFWSFFPQKNKKRRNLMSLMATVPGVHIFFESPFRIRKTLELFAAEDERWQMVVGRELTKKFETIERGKPSELLTKIDEAHCRGEFSVCVMRIGEDDEDAGDDED